MTIKKERMGQNIEDMSGLNDAFTIGIIMMIILGAVFFYFYTRIGQVEKRMKLLETILLDLKVATESSFIGFNDESADSGVPAAAAVSVAEAEVETEDDYAADAADAADVPAPAHANVDTNVFEDVPEVFKTFSEPVSEVLPSEVTSPAPATEELVIEEKHNDTYEYMSIKELSALAKQRGVSGINKMKRQELLKAIRHRESDVSLNAPVQVFEDVAGASTDDAFGQMAPIE